jgi:hypothetical protein
MVGKLAQGTSKPKATLKSNIAGVPSFPNFASE